MAPTSRSPRRRLLAAAALLVGTGAVMTLSAMAGGLGSEARVVPAFTTGATTQPSPTAATETAVFAGGCFWGVQAVFQHVKGVSNAVSGYAGGEAATAVYESVGSGSTGHAEAVQVSFDPRQVSYAQLLQIYFSVAHDPTQLNRQGPDTGPQYRSAIFPASDDQARTARAYVEQLDKAHAFKSPIATRIETGRRFFPAEAYHQDYLARNPRQPYIVFNDMPKLDDLKRLFPQAWRAEPVLVGAKTAAG
jgi:peptide-methionine (S)-S-oxide reductase